MPFKHLALSSSGRQVVVRGAAPDWLSGQATRCRMAATRWQPAGPGLFARIPASSLSRGRTSTSSFFLGLRANNSRRGPWGNREQALGSVGRVDHDAARRALGLLRYHDLQHAVAVAGGDVLGVDAVGQCEAAMERAVRPLLPRETAGRVGRLGRALAAD